MTIKTFCAPFSEAITDERRDCHLRPGDIDNALKAFGPGLVKLYINPMYLEEKGKHFIKYDFPENLIVEGHAGVAGWELQGEVKDEPMIIEVTGRRGAGMSLANLILSFEGIRGDGGMTNFSTLKVMDEMLKDKNSITEKQVPEKRTGDIVLNRHDKRHGEKPVNTSPLPHKEHPNKSKALEISHPTASLRVNSDKTSDKTPRIMKHGGGRPRKATGYSKRTEQRREKEKQKLQGVMAI